jgi:hypothetical protein
MLSEEQSRKGGKRSISSTMSRMGLRTLGALKWTRREKKEDIQRVVLPSQAEVSNERARKGSSDV